MAFTHGAPTRSKGASVPQPTEIFDSSIDPRSGNERAMSERPVVHSLALMPHQDDRAGQESIVDRLLNDRINPLQPTLIDTAPNLAKRERSKPGHE